MEGDRRNEEDARENGRRQRAPGLAGGNNRPRGFESSPTNSHKLVFSSARESETGECGKEGDVHSRGREIAVRGWLHGDDFTW